MKLLSIGRTREKYLQTGIEEYVGRLQHYIRFEYLELADVKIQKGTTRERVCEQEGIELLKHIDQGAYVVLLDEKGKQFTSVQLAESIQKRFNSGGKEFVLIVGGPYGFSEDVKSRANELWSLSKMTFSHQMVRLIAVEQIYRAMTILRNEPYHHD